jgi:murein tripeptide amidase MpaA
MRSVVLLILVLAIAVSAFSPKRHYSQYRLVRVNLRSENALNHLVKIVGEENLDVWSNDGTLTLGKDMDILVSPMAYEQLKSYFDSARPAANQFSSLTVSKFELIHSNIQDIMDESEAKQLQANGDDFFAKYRSYDELIAFTKDLSAAYPQYTKIESVGFTWEKREIIAIHISTGGNGTRPIMLLNGLQHAREWIGGMVVAYAMKNLLEGYASKVQRVVDLLDKIDIIIVPVLNPDGYSFTWTKDRLWRKNRRDNGGGIYGVDMNRNWQIGYGVGASSSPSSLTYKGPNPLSEPENQAYDKFIRNYQQGSRIKGAIDFHSYSQLVLRPWDYQSAASKDEATLKAVGGAMQSAIRNTHKVEYQNIRGVELYPAGGALNDQFYGQYGIPMGYTIELRDTGRYGFLLPPDQILPCSEENWNAILTLGDYVYKE